MVQNHHRRTFTEEEEAILRTIMSPLSATHRKNWKKITTTFNQASPHSPRVLNSLQSKWRRMSKRQRHSQSSPSSSPITAHDDEGSPMTTHDEEGSPASYEAVSLWTLSPEVQDEQSLFGTFSVQESTTSHEDEQSLPKCTTETSTPIEALLEASEDPLDDPMLDVLAQIVDQDEMTCEHEDGLMDNMVVRERMLLRDGQPPILVEDISYVPMGLGINFT